MKSQLQSRKMRKIMRKMFPKGRVRVQVNCRSEERSKENDFFPSGCFSHENWSAKSYFAADEVRTALDSFSSR